VTDAKAAATDDQSDARTFLNFGSRESGESSDNAVLHIHEDSIEYDMKHKKFGKCLIFNHEYYENNRNPQRSGSTADASALYQSFSKLGFDVTMKNDLPYKKFWDCLSSVAKEDHSDSDCLVVCILTHGETGDQLWAYDEIYSLDHVIGLFAGDKCKSLAGKPKIFIIQACRGMKFDDGVVVQVSKDVTDSGRFKTIKIPVYSDFMIAYSTMSGFYSWRNPYEGSWFIGHLTEVIDKYYSSYDLLSMMTIVNQRVAYQKVSKTMNPDFNDKKQVPCLTHTLTRKIYFAPKDNGPKSTYL